MEDQSGKRFGMLTVLEFGHRRGTHNYWKCKCDCGVVKEIEYSGLHSGAVVSCGCKNRKNPVDLTGMRFGQLTVLEKTNKPESKKYIRATFWLCQCECGKTTVASKPDLCNGNVVSCGCVGRKRLEFGRNTENQKKAKDAYRSRMKEPEFRENMGYINNTYIGSLKFSVSGKLRSNNTSGCTGVMWSKQKNKWIAVIFLKHHLYTLGGFRDMKDAILARKLAEERMFLPEIEAFENKKAIREFLITGNKTKKEEQT